MDVSASVFVDQGVTVEVGTMASGWPLVLRLKSSCPLGGPASVGLHLTLAKAEETVAALSAQIAAVKERVYPKAAAATSAYPVGEGALLDAARDIEPGLGDIHNLTIGDAE